jgi:hypothetical protein
MSIADSIIRSNYCGPAFVGPTRLGARAKS